MINKNLLIFLLCVGILLSSCTGENKAIGPYSLSCIDCKIITNRTGDSYTGKIFLKDNVVHFDYGYYSPTLIESEEEYLNSRRWLMNAESYYFSQKNGNLDSGSKLTVEKIVRQSDSNFVNNDAEFIAYCVYQSDTLKWPIKIPEKIKQHKIFIDSCNGFYRKTVIPKNGQSGIVGMYLYNINDFNREINNYSALSLHSEAKNINQVNIIKAFLDSNFNCNRLKR